MQRGPRSFGTLVMNVEQADQASWKIDAMIAAGAPATVVLTEVRQIVDGWRAKENPKRFAQAVAVSQTQMLILDVKPNAIVSIVNGERVVVDAVKVRGWIACIWRLSLALKRISRAQSNQWGDASVRSILCFK